MIKFTVKIPKGPLERLTEALSAEARGRVVERVAFVTLNRLQTKVTPRRWFGQVRRSWQMSKPTVDSRLLYNDNKVMLWLEEGTKDHGPVKAKMLYIPLTRAASFGYKPGMKFGVDFILKKRVKGIEARWIARDEAIKAEKLLLASMKAHVKAAIA